MKTTWQGRTALTIAAAAAMATFAGGTSGAEPVAGQDPSNNSPAVAASIAHLRQIADVERNKVLSFPTPPQSFFFPATTIGCSSIGNPVLFTAGTAQAGPSAFPPIKDGQIGFQAVPGRPGPPISSNIQVTWLNPQTGKSGVTKLDGPNLYSIVDTGPGIVVAELNGTIEYPPAPVEQLSGSSCIVTPTVGAFVS